MAKPIALVVDDEPDIRELLGITLERMDIDAVACADIAAAKAQLTRREFQLCLTDMRLPDGDGIDLIEWMQLRGIGTPVAVITAHGNVETAVRALKAGAFDFISKPVDIKVLRKLVGSALKVPHTGTASGKARLLGESPAIEQLRVTIAKVARSQAPVHITGESGTGKELVARMIHEQGSRAEAPFVPVNCGAIPGELMESEFFGHRKGSFTGAVSDKEGLFQSAEGGTLFMDEIADLPLPMQVKLLRVIQEKSLRPVGQTAEATGRRAHPLGHPQGSARTGRQRPLPRRPLLPHQRHRAARAAAARARRRHPAAQPPHPRAAGRRHGPATAGTERRRARQAGRLPFPRQCARTGEHPRTGHRAQRRRDRRRRHPPPAPAHRRSGFSRDLRWDRA